MRSSAFERRMLFERQGTPLQIPARLAPGEPASIAP
jgi:hypothetical protein